jgi:hypothetical protein
MKYLGIIAENPKKVGCSYMLCVSLGSQRNEQSGLQPPSAAAITERKENIYEPIDSS